MSFSVRVDSQEVQEYINSVSSAMLNMSAITRQQLEKSMQMAKDLAQIYAPVDSGKLRDNIHLESKSENSITIVADPVNIYGQSYAAFPEYGTVKQPEQSYIRIALEESLVEMITGTVYELSKMFIKRAGEEGINIT